MGAIPILQPKDSPPSLARGRKGLFFICLSQPAASVKVTLSGGHRYIRYYEDGPGSVRGATVFVGPGEGAGVALGLVLRGVRTTRRCGRSL